MADDIPADNVKVTDTQESGPGPGGPRLTTWREETPNEDELGRATPNYPVDHKGVPDGTQSDGEARFTQD